MVLDERPGSRRVVVFLGALDAPEVSSGATWLRVSLAAAKTIVAASSVTHWHLDCDGCERGGGDQSAVIVALELGSFSVPDG